MYKNETALDENGLMERINEENIDRRKKTKRNMLRRFINEFWLVPLFIIYIQFYVAVINVHNPTNSVIEANKNFIAGIAFLKNIVAKDFPYTIKGHMLEIYNIVTFQTDYDQIPTEQLASYINTNENKIKILNMIYESKKIRNSEVGGVILLKDGELVIHEVNPINRILSQKLHQHKANSGDFYKILSDDYNKQIIYKVGVDKKIISDIEKNLRHPLLPEKVKMDIINNFVSLYDSMSEYNYLLMPIDFKTELGRYSSLGTYVGFFHIHNGIYEPPSEVDVNRSYEERQIIFTLSKNGFLTYDVSKGQEHTIMSMVEN